MGVELCDIVVDVDGVLSGDINAVKGVKHPPQSRPGHDEPLMSITPASKPGGHHVF